MEECKKCTECQLHFTKCNGTHDAVCLIDVLTTTQRKSVDYDTSTAASPTPTTQTTGMQHQYWNYLYRILKNHLLSFNLSCFRDKLL